MKYSILLLIAAASISAFGGGTSSIGGIAPEYTCQDSTGNVHVTVGLGDSNTQVIYVSTDVPSTFTPDTNVQLTEGPGIGAPIVVSGDRFTLTLNVDGPRVISGGQSGINSQLQDRSVIIPALCSNPPVPGVEQSGCVQPPTLAILCTATP